MCTVLHTLYSAAAEFLAAAEATRNRLAKELEEIKQQLPDLNDRGSSQVRGPDNLGRQQTSVQFMET